MKNRAGLWFQAAFTLLWAVLCGLAAFGFIWDKDEVHAPRWLLLACAATLFLVALHIISVATGGDARRGALETLLRVWIGPIVVLFLAVGFLWIGFGPGERHSTASGLVGFFVNKRIAGEIETRVVFGGAGILTGLLAIFAVRYTWRSSKTNRSAPNDQRTGNR